MPSVSTEIKSWPLKLLTFNILSKEFRVEIRNEALCALKKKRKRKNCIRGLQMVRQFGEEIFTTPDSCIFSNLEKH